MKILELQLKKNVLIFQPDERGNINSWIALHSKKWNFICLGLELTEEIASELVEEHYMNGIRSYEIYNDYKYNDSRWLDDAKESLISAVESKGFFWLEKECDNQFCENGKVDVGYNTFLNCQVCEEAEEKTFKNPLIFVKKQYAK